LDRWALKKRHRVLQTLSAGYFQPGKKYLMWFKQSKGVSTKLPLSARLHFVDKPEDKWEHPELEKALSLIPKKADEQVRALDSRGGRILLDKRFFDKDYADNRIDSAFFSIRRTKRLKGGYFITIRTSVPSCGTKPKIKDIIGAYGDPDFIQTKKEANQVREHAGGDPDEDDLDITTYYYDYFALEVSAKEKSGHVLRVATHGENFGAFSLTSPDPTFAQIGTRNLTIFKKGSKESGRLFYFDEGVKKPLVIIEPPTGTYHTEFVTYKYLGKGRWIKESTFRDGKTARVDHFKEHQLSGQSDFFYPSGSKRFTANYKKGQLHGKMIEFDEDGKILKEDIFKEGKKIEETQKKDSGR